MVPLRLRFFVTILACLGRTFIKDLWHDCQVVQLESFPLLYVFLKAQVSEEVFEHLTLVNQVAFPRVVSFAVDAVEFPEKLFEAAQQKVVHAM